MEPVSTLYANVILHGEGLRGLAHVGALTVAEELGYQLVNIAGTSAGAIIAALLAAGYTAHEIFQIMSEVDYGRIADDEGLSSSSVTRLFGSRGKRRASKYIEQFVRELLQAKGIRTFGDLLIPALQDDPNPFLRYRLTLIALDIVAQQLLRLPQDIIQYGLDPNEVDVALAVLMTTIDQAHFEPIKLRSADGTDHQMVGAGILDATLFDMSGIPDRPAFYICVVDDASSTEIGTSPPLLYRPLNNMIQAVWSVNAGIPLLHSDSYLDDEMFTLTISIPASGISAQTINLTRDQAQTLYENGRRGARTFFSTWNFEAYKAYFRSGSPPSTRRENLRMKK